MTKKGVESSADWVIYQRPPPGHPYHLIAARLHPGLLAALDECENEA